MAELDDLLEHLERYRKDTRIRTMRALKELDEGRLDAHVLLGEGRPVETLRWWLWLLIEHEVHHKAQIAVYLRQMGTTPPDFAAALENGARPDEELREKLGGF